MKLCADLNAYKGIITSQSQSICSCYVYVCNKKKMTRVKSQSSERIGGGQLKAHLLKTAVNVWKCKREGVSVKSMFV